MAELTDQETRELAQLVASGEIKAILAERRAMKLVEEMKAQAKAAADRAAANEKKRKRSPAPSPPAAAAAAAAAAKRHLSMRDAQGLMSMLQRKLDACPAVQACGVTVKLGNYTVTGDRIATSLRANVVDESVPRLPVDEETDRAAYGAHCARYGLKKEWRGRTFSFKGDRHVLYSIKPENRKFPLLARRVSDGRLYKFPPATVLRGLGERAAHESAEASAAETKEWKDNCRRFGLRVTDQNKIIVVRGKRLKLITIKPRNRKYPLIVIDLGTGKRMKYGMGSGVMLGLEAMRASS